MKPIYRHTLFVLAIAAMPAVAAAEDAFTLQQTDIYAGPSSDYPQIASLPPNSEVGVAGCLSDWSWCDVRFANDRGWVWAGDLAYPYEGRRVAIIEFGPRLHLPALTFSLNTYWDAHYRSRPFYRERNVWVSRVRIEGSHGGKAPHGGTRVAQPSGGARPGPTAQGRPQVQGQAQVQGGQQQPRREQGAQAEQRSREQAQNEQRSRQQAQNEQRSRQQAQNEQRSRQQAGQAEQQRSREQAQQHAQASQQGNMAKSQQRPQPEASRSMQGEQHAQNTSRSEAAHPETNRGASAKGSQGEHPKEKEREANQQ